MSWSPSTTWPRSSTISSRSASPSSAMPMSARTSRTLRGERAGLGRAAFLVDVEAVGLDADLDDLGAELPQRVGRDLVGGAVGAVDHDAQAFERQIARQRALGEFDVAVLHAVDALGAAEIGRLREPLGEVAVDQLLDLELDLVGQLVAVRTEQLDAVVVVRIVRGGDHHAEIGAHRARQHGDRRRRHRAGEQHVHADRGEARHQRGLDHVAGQPRVLADQHAMAMLAVLEHHARGLPDLEGKLRRDRAVGAAANAVGAEILANHADDPRTQVCAPNGAPHTDTYRASLPPMASRNMCDRCVRRAPMRNLIRALPRRGQPRKSRPKRPAFARTSDAVSLSWSVLFRRCCLSILLFGGWVMLTGSEPAIDSSKPLLQLPLHRVVGLWTATELRTSGSPPRFLVAGCSMRSLLLGEFSPIYNARRRRLRSQAPDRPPNRRFHAIAGRVPRRRACMKSVSLHRGPAAARAAQRAEDVLRLRRRRLLQRGDAARQPRRHGAHQAAPARPGERRPAQHRDHHPGRERCRCRSRSGRSGSAA